MKLMIVTLLMSFTILSKAQSGKQVIDGISKNDLTLVEEQLSNWVILSINNSTNTLRKSEAIQQLSDYLSKIQPNGFQTRHSGRANDQHLRYIVSNLNSVEGKHRLFIYVNDIESKVKEIRLTAVQQYN